MKQASFQIGNSLNKEKNNVSVSEYVTNVPKEVNVQKEIKNTITSHTITSHIITNNTNDTKTHNKPKKLVENIYYF
jgi:hypothetical protein